MRPPPIHWYDFVGNKSGLKRAFPGGVPELERIQITRIVFEANNLFINLFLNPLPKGVSHKWTEAGYFCADLRLSFLVWNDVVNEVPLNLIPGWRRLTIEANRLFIEDSDMEVGKRLFSCSWKILRADLLPGLEAADVSRMQDLYGTDVESSLPTTTVKAQST